MSASRESSLREYRRRIKAVLDHLQKHLGDDHALDDLARIADLRRMGPYDHDGLASSGKNSVAGPARAA